MQRLLLALIATAIIAAPSVAEIDSDGDGIPDAVEYELGTDPHRAEEFILQHRDGIIGVDDDTYSDQHANAPDFVEIYLANVAQDRWLWKITFAEDYVAEGNTFHFYLDVDGDPETGRQDAGWVQGIDLMFSQIDGEFRLSRQTEGLHPGEPRMAIVGDTLYICADLPLGEGPGEPRFRVLSHVSPPHNADADRMDELRSLTLPERRDARKPRIGAPPPLAPVAELTTDRQDTSGDGIPDHIKRVLGMPYEEYTTFYLAGEDGTVAGGDETDNFELANDIHRVYFANAAGDRWVWRIDFADEFQTEGRLVHLYLDCDMDPLTGRQDSPGVQGTDIMLTCSGGNFQTMYVSADVLSDNRDLRGVIDGNSLYYSMDLKLHHNEQGNSEHRIRVLSQYPSIPGENDNAGWFSVCGPGESDIVKPRVGSMAEIYSDGVHVESPWLYWRQQLREMDALAIDLAAAETTGMTMEDRALVAIAEGAIATIRSPVAGAFYLHLVLQDSLERHEEIVVTVAGETLANIVLADDDGLVRIFSIPEAVTLAEGAPITLASDGPAQDGRIVEMFLTRDPLEPAGMAIHDIAAYCPPGQVGDTVNVDVVFLTNDACVGVVEWGRGDSLDQTIREDRVTYSHSLTLEGLERGATYSYRVIAGIEEDAVASEVHTFVADFIRPERCGVDRAQVPLIVSDPLDSRPAWAISGGIPIPQGHLSDIANCRVLKNGQPVPADFRELAWWQDGSIRWLLVSLLHEGGDYLLEYGADVSGPQIDRPIVVEETADGLVITTDVLRAEISRENFSPPGALWLDPSGEGNFTEAGRIISANEGAVLVDAEGNRYSTAGQPVERLIVEESGPVRTVILAEGRFAGDEGTLLGWSCRMYFTRGFPGVPTVFTLLADEGDSIRPPTMTNIQSLTIPVDFAGAGAEQASRVLHDYDNRYIVTTGGVAEEHTGFVTPTGSLHADGRGISVAMRNFWQMYPKAFSVEGNTVTAEIFPELPADQYQDQDLTPLQTTMYYYWCADGNYMIPMGVALSYDLLFYAGDGSFEGLAEAWDQIPVLATSPEAYCASGVFGDLEPEQPGVFEIYQDWVVDGLNRLEDRRRRTREYDWLSFGDTHGERSVNWTNQEYDLQWGLLIQFVRSGDWRFFQRAEEAARHFGAVDTVHFAPVDTLVGIQKAHCLGHVGGFPMERPEGTQYWFEQGIWNTGHMWTQGQLTMWAMTGDRRHLDSGMINADWFTREETRYLPDYVHRSPGWSTLAVLGAYEIVPHPRYLNAARLFVQNTIARQCPGTGTLIHRIGECECPIKHVGGKTFMTGVVMSAMKMLDSFDPNPDVRESIVRSADWIGWRMWQPENNSFQYAQCAQFDGTPTHAGTYMICEGLAEAHNLSGNPLHREMLERSLGDMIVNRNPSASGKGYAMQIRVVPWALSLMQQWGMTELEPPPPPDPRVGMADSIYLPAEGAGLLALRVNNPSRQNLPARMEITALPEGLTADVTSSEWTAGGGVTLGPTVRLSGAGAGEVRLRYAVGDAAGELSATIRPARELALGGGTGLVTGAGDPVAQALAQLEIDLETLPDLRQDTLSGYNALLVGSEAHEKNFAGLQQDWPMLLDFIGSGGRVAFTQLQDSAHEPGFLPLPLTLSDDPTALGEIVAQEHPLFAGVGQGILDSVSYDSITSVDEGWTVLALDRGGNPSVVEAQIGSGAVLLFQASPERYIIGSESPAGRVSIEACQQFLRNVVTWLQAH